MIVDKHVDMLPRAVYMYWHRGMTIMPDPNILQRALARRKQLVRELEKLPTYQELIRLEQFVQFYHELEGEGRGRKDIEPHGRGVGRRQRRKTIADVAVDICLDKGEPIPVRELIGLLAERGRPVGGKNPTINLSSILSRDPRFENVPGRGWHLKGRNTVDE